MKKIIYTFIVLLLSASIFLPFGQAIAQAPQRFRYQAEIRDGSREIIANQQVGLKVSILQGSTSGKAVYVETHTPTTNEFGLINPDIGKGNVVSGDFSGIDWGSDNYFVKIDVTNRRMRGSRYKEMETSQLLSVPSYALQAKTVKSIPETTTVYGVNIVKHGVWWDDNIWDVLEGEETGHYIGESYGGGTVFWLDETGEHGLIATTTDQNERIKWCNGVFPRKAATGDGVGAGEMNTMLIVSEQRNGSYAAKLCADLVVGEYGDWYLPSKYELNLMYLQRGTIGGFVEYPYWSSTEDDEFVAWLQNFYNGSQFCWYEFDDAFVRAIRAF